LIDIPPVVKVVTYDWPTGGSKHVVLNDVTGKLHELWYSGGNVWNHAILTDAAAAPLSPFYLDAFWWKGAEKWTSHVPRCRSTHP
jgi:hypothetical protein